MHCPFCNALETKVIDSRLVSEGSQVRRRRECLGCQERFNTYERAELVMPMVIKRDGNRVPFSETNLRKGLLKALEKRPVSVDKVDDAVAKIKQRLRACGEREIASQYIGEQVMNHLSQLDHVAYVRFASVYKNFTDVSEFNQAIESLKSENGEVR